MPNWHWCMTKKIHHCKNSRQKNRPWPQSSFTLICPNLMIPCFLAIRIKQLPLRLHLLTVLCLFLALHFYIYKWTNEDKCSCQNNSTGGEAVAKSTMLSLLPFVSKHCWSVFHWPCDASRQENPSNGQKHERPSTRGDYAKKKKQRHCCSSFSPR